MQLLPFNLVTESPSPSFVGMSVCWRNTKRQRMGWIGFSAISADSMREYDDAAVKP